MMNIDTNIQFIKGVGEKRAQLFRRLGIATVGDLLHFYPRDYEDWSKISKINELPDGVRGCVAGHLSYPPELRQLQGSRILITAMITDGASFLKLVFFNNRYIVDKLKEGKEYVFFGKIERDSYYGERQMVSPRFLPLEECESGLFPIYRQTEKLNSRQIAKIVRNALDGIRDTLEETLPVYLIEKYRLLPLWEALEKIHFPKTEDEVAQARRRLSFEELLSLELGLLSVHSEQSGGICLVNRTEEFFPSLPFSLTNAQKRCIREAAEDMAGGKQMRRLIQGDVGSGKTVVAAALVYSCAKNGLQAALMAPTEVLAGQHYRSFCRFFENTEIRTAILTGSMTKKSKDMVKRQLENGEIDLIIGTHALIQSGVFFHRLGLVITDEQHRFGVNQRAALVEKGGNPHLLVMSATPIPRTLGLIIYGDMDISLLDELPKGRQPIDTFLVDSSYRPRLYKFLEKHFSLGQQGYIICPLVEEGVSETELLPAEDYYKYLQTEVFPHRRLGLLHGKMKSQEKEKIMQEFADGKIHLLISTTVVEVGVDVPNATVMIIENADRFGLSQLHQLRGRVGRGKEKSYCVLVSDSKKEETGERLKIICANSDGFKIADEDLRLRGPGDFFGERQHGLPLLKIADLSSDEKILIAARKIAEAIIKEDSSLKLAKNKPLRQSVARLFGDDFSIFS